MSDSIQSVVSAEMNTVLNSSVFHLNNIRDQVPLKLAPDSFAVITDSAFTYVTYTEGAGKDKSTDSVLKAIYSGKANNTYFKKGLTQINVSGSVQAGTGQASLSLTCPYYEDEDSYYVTKGEGVRVHHFHPAMEVQVFTKGRFPLKSHEVRKSVDGKDGAGTEMLTDTPVYYRTFWGVVKGVEESLDGQSATISITCTDLLFFWSHDYMNTVASLDPFTLQLLQVAQKGDIQVVEEGKGQDAATTGIKTVEFTNGSASALGGLNPWEIVATMFINPQVYAENDGGTKKAPDSYSITASGLMTPTVGLTDDLTASGTARLSASKQDFVQNYAHIMSFTMRMWYERLKGMYVTKPDGSSSGAASSSIGGGTATILPKFLKIYGLFGEELTEEVDPKFSTAKYKFSAKYKGEEVKATSTKMTHFNTVFRWRKPSTTGIEYVYGPGAAPAGETPDAKKVREAANTKKAASDVYSQGQSTKLGQLAVVNTFLKGLSTSEEEQKAASIFTKQNGVKTFNSLFYKDEQYDLGETVGDWYRLPKDILSDTAYWAEWAKRGFGPKLVEWFTGLYNKMMSLDPKAAARGQGGQDPNNRNLNEDGTFAMPGGEDGSGGLWSRDMVLEELYEDSGFYKDVVPDLNRNSSKTYDIKLYRVRMKQLSSARFKAIAEINGKLGEKKEKEAVESIKANATPMEPRRAGTPSQLVSKVLLPTFRLLVSPVARIIDSGAGRMNSAGAEPFDDSEITANTAANSTWVMAQYAISKAKANLLAREKDPLLVASINKATLPISFDIPNPVTLEASETRYQSRAKDDTLFLLRKGQLTQAWTTFWDKNEDYITASNGRKQAFSIDQNGVFHINYKVVDDNLLNGALDGRPLAAFLLPSQSGEKAVLWEAKIKEGLEKALNTMIKAFEDNILEPLTEFQARKAAYDAGVAQQVQDATQAFKDASVGTVKFSSAGQLQIDATTYKQALGGLELSRAMGVFEAFQPWTNLAETIAKKPDFQTRLDIAKMSAEKIGFELYQDLGGDIIFKPPYYNMDVSSHPAYVIEAADVVSFSESEDSDDVMNFFEVRVPWSNVTLGGESGEKMASSGIYYDPGLIAMYGLRHTIVELPVAMVQSGATGDGAVERANEVMDCLAAVYCSQAMAKIFSASLTIPMRPEIKIGHPIYLSHKDSYYYVTSISHSYSADGSAQTSLTLEAKRDRVRYFPATAYINDLKGPTPHRVQGGKKSAFYLGAKSDYTAIDIPESVNFGQLRPDDILYGFVLTSASITYASKSGKRGKVDPAERIKSFFGEDSDSATEWDVLGAKYPYSPTLRIGTQPRSYRDQDQRDKDKKHTHMHQAMFEGYTYNPSNTGKMNTIFNAAQAQKFSWIQEANMPEYSEQLRIRSVQQGSSTPFFDLLHAGGMGLIDELSEDTVPLAMLGADREFAMHHYTRYSRPLSDASGFLHIGGLPYGSTLRLLPPKGAFYAIDQDAEPGINDTDQLRSKLKRISK